MHSLNNSHNALPDWGLSPSLYGQMQTRSTFGATLKALRKGLKPKKSQEEVASAIGATQAMYSKWETGTVMPGLDYAVRLARVLRVGLDELVAGIDEAYDLSRQTRTELSSSQRSKGDHDEQSGTAIGVLEAGGATAAELHALSDHLAAAQAKLIAVMSRAGIGASTGGTASADASGRDSRREDRKRLAR